MLKYLSRFFWTCSGAAVSLMEDCKTEHSKYTGIGAAIFTTGILAGASASFAFFTVFHSIKWAVAFGIFWGLMIFNLDRYIVVSIKKRRIDSQSSWKVRLKALAGEFVIAAPRLLLAALLAFVIARPLELAIFENEILLEMESLRTDQSSDIQNQVGGTQTDATNSRLSGQIKTLNDQNNSLENEIKALDEDYTKKVKELDKEYKGQGEGTRPGIGHYYGLREQEMNRAKPIYEEAVKTRREKIEANKPKIKQLEGLQLTLSQNAVQRAQTTDGLATRLEAFDRLTAKRAPVRHANWAILAIIMILEIAPILTKVFASYGPYDRLVEGNENKFYHQKQMEDDELAERAIERKSSNLKRRLILDSVKDSFVSELQGKSTGSVQGLSAQTDWEEAKSILIEQAVNDLTHRNGDSS